MTGSAAAAREVLIRDVVDPRDAARLMFRVQNKALPIALMGSWGFLITAPMAAFIVQGEYPPNRAYVVALIGLLGVGLVYGAIRAAVNGACLDTEGHALRLRRLPLPPAMTRRWALGEIEAVEVALRRGSFWNPDTYRGLPVAQPFLLTLRLAGGRRARMPLALGREDAQIVAAWIDRRRSGALAPSAPS